MKTSELLRNAGKAIETLGFHKGDYVGVGKDDEPCGLCALGAVRVSVNGWTPEAPAEFDVFGAAVYGGLEASGRAEIYLENALREILPDGTTYYIPWWNDAEERTQDEVLALFELAATRAEEAGD